MGDVIGIDRKKNYYFTRKVIRKELFMVSAKTEEDGRKELENTLTPMKYCLCSRIVDASEFQHDKLDDIDM